MDCQRIEEENMVERYLVGQLPEAETEAFEQHYLGCPGCFQELQFRHAAAIELKRGPLETTPNRALLWRPRWTWGLLAAAVLLLSLIPLTLLNRRQNPELVQIPSAHQGSREAVIAQLAVIDAAPAYAPSTIRGGKGGTATARFQEGMQRYLQQNYSAAAGLLEEAVRQDPDRQPALFYLGISHLMLGEPDKAIGVLSKLTRMETNPYQEESHWYLAKAFLKKRDLASAQMELEAVVPLNGPHLSEAKQALEMITNVAKESRQ